MAGAIGTAAMTAWQELSSKLQSSGSEGSDESGESDERQDRDAAESSQQEQEQEQEQQDPESEWEQASMPAQVGRRILKGIFQEDVSPDKIPVLTHAMHWAYGTGWGAVYGLMQGTLRANPIRHGALFGAGVWAMSYVQLVPMGLYQPPWSYPPKQLALDGSYHLVYGLGVAAGYRVVAGDTRVRWR